MNLEKTYQSDLSNEEWGIIEPLIPVYVRGRTISVNMREVINGIFYLIKTGCQWDYIPKDYPPKTTIYYYFKKWSLDGTWKTIHDTLRRQVRVKAGHDPEPSAGILDSQSVKTTEAADEKGFDGGKKVKGRKRQLLVDVLGLLLSVKVHPANIHDSIGAKDIFNGFNHETILRIWADGGYQGDFQKHLKNQHQIVVEIVKSIKYDGKVPLKYQNTKQEKTTTDITHNWN